MARGLNYAEMIGTVSEFKTDGTKARFTVTADSSYVNSAGERKEQINWMSVVVEDGTPIANGSVVFVQGPVRTRTWKRANGTDAYMQQIEARKAMVLAASDEGIVVLGRGTKSHNQMTLKGNLAAEPEGRFTPGGLAVTSLRVMTGSEYTDRNGNKVSTVEAINVVIWDKLAEIANQYLSKGSSVLVMGRLDTRKYDDKEGNKRTATELIAQELQLPDKPKDTDSGPRASSAVIGKRAETPSLDDVDEDEIPF